MISGKVLRRFAILTAFLAVLSPALFAGGGAETKSAAKPAAKGGNEWHEAPMLHQKVAAGQLPALAQRLPKDVFVEKVVERIGDYGGDWHMTWNGLGAKWGIGSTTEEAMFRFSQDGKAVIPNVAKSVKINDNSTEFTITLREGMKWSDGMPFTADDVLFFWEELLVPGTYSKQVLGYPAFYTVAADGKKVLCKVEKIDALTVKITHAAPYPTFLQRMAIDTKWFFAPAHYYKTILPKFVGQDKALEIAKKHGFGDVTAWLKDIGYYYWIYPERPTLRAWKGVNDATDTRWTLERNPYFWKTDAEGNQLPYIDRIVIDLTEDKLVPMKAIAGELDLQEAPGDAYTLIKENEKKGDYRVINWRSAGTASNTVECNQTVKDPGLRTLFQDQRFRAGLSVAINRSEVNEIVYGGRQIPQQASILEGLPYSSAAWSKKYAEYDPAGAAKFFDQVGLPWDKDHKYRTRPDGSELLMLVHYATAPANDQVFELVKKYWESVGLKTVVKPVERSFLEQLRNSNDFQIASWGSQVFDIKLRPDELVPTRLLNYWSGQYGPYYESSGKIGEKATGDILALQDAMGKMLAAKTLAEMDSWAQKIADLHEKNIWIIGITGGAPTSLVVKNNFRNVPGGMYNTDELRYLGIANPVQFFIQSGQ